jgi:hypothetical protein
MSILFLRAELVVNHMVGRPTAQSADGPDASTKLKVRGISNNLHHKVRIYKEYHSVCPLVGIGTLPTPLPPARMPPPPPVLGGGGYSLAREGLGSPNSDDWRKSLALYLLCALHRTTILKEMSQISN